jgi:PKD repeat protein
VHWIECDPAFTSNPTLPQCEDPLYTLDSQLWPECNPLYTTSPVTWPVCHYTSDPASVGCEEPWPTQDFTWDPQLWPQYCGPRTTYDPNWWCEPMWTADPAAWPGCNPGYTSLVEVPQCYPGYTYDAGLWPECEAGLYTYNPDVWPECEFYTADARIWSECHYTSDVMLWPECGIEPPYPTKDYTSDPRLWPECDVGVPPNYTTDPTAFAECHYTSDAPIWPECDPPPEDLGDLGDAPDSTNHAGSTMTAYPAGGPPGVNANYPTVFDPLTGLPKGPLHNQPRADAWLGAWVTREYDADLPPDEDGLTNILPASDAPDTDGFDDGVNVPLAAPHCVPTVFTYTVTITPGATMRGRYVNVWFDWLRDGDWDDLLECPDGTLAPEWAVQNQLLPSLPPGTYVFNTPAFLPWSPPGANIQDIWMRISIAEQPAPSPEDGRGPPSGYEYGETEDYYFKPECPLPVADFTWDPPTICPTTTVQFWDTSANSPTSWSWDFGDGLGSSTAQNPSYSYSTAGVGSYNVSLTVSNICGPDTITKTVVVTDCNPPDQYYDIYIKDNASDDGSVPSSSPWWVSPDIWVRNDGDCTQTAHQNPIVGTLTTVCVRVRNRATTQVDNITVNVYWTNAALGTWWPGNWNYVSSLSIPSLAGGATIVGSVSWNVPYFTGHACLLARADAPHDPLGSGPDTVLPVDNVPNNNNIGQTNSSIANAPEITTCGYFTSTVYTDTIYFDAVNTTSSNKTVSIVFDSAEFPLSSGTLQIEPGSLWGRWTGHPGFSESSPALLATALPASMDGIVLAPHETARLTMTVAAEIDERFTISVQEKAGTEVVGGIDYVRDLPICMYVPVIIKSWSP